jgi:unsaturated rhamnogalacturonyl hydrolase
MFSYNIILLTASSFAALALVLLICRYSTLPAKTERYLRMIIWGRTRTSFYEGNKDEFISSVLRITRKELLHPYFDPASRKLLSRIKFWYPAAICALAVETEHKLLNNDENITCIKKYYSKFIDRLGNFRNSDVLKFIDNCMHGYTLCYLYDKTMDSRYISAADTLYSFLIKHPRTTGGFIPYRKEYPAMLLVDTTGMICPFLSRYASIKNIDEGYEIASAHILDILNNATDYKTGFPFHGHIEGGSVIGIPGWCRGTGWFMLGIVGLLEYLPKNYPAYNSIQSRFSLLVENLAMHQKKDGCWAWAITNPYSSPETSGTALISYSISKALNLGIIDSGCKDILIRSFRGLASFTTSNGYVTGASGDCIFGPGAYSLSFGHHMWAQGAAGAFFASMRHILTNPA